MGKPGRGVQPPSLRIDARLRGDVAVLDLHGRLDVPFELDLMRRIERLVSEGYRRIVVDCSGLDYLSSRGVSAFIAMLDDIREADGDLKLVGVTPQASMVLERLGVARLIQQFAFLDAALQAFDTSIGEYLAKEGLDFFVASETGRVFHASRCRSAARIRRRLTFPSKEHARRAGLRACRRCC